MWSPTRVQDIFDSKKNLYGETSKYASILSDFSDTKMVALCGGQKVGGNLLLEPLGTQFS